LRAAKAQPHAAKRSDDLTQRVRPLDRGLSGQDNAVGADDEIEPTEQAGMQPQHVGLDEAGLQASLFGERLGPADRRSGEIQASDPGSQPGPVERVEAEVALQVKQVEAGHVTAQRQLGGPQRAGAGEEARDVVVAVLAVHRCPLVPVPDIEPASLLQRAKTGLFCHDHSPPADHRPCRSCRSVNGQ